MNKTHRPLTALLYGGQVGAEVRTLYFYKAFGLPQDRMRIISFGACNFHCKYCKRGSFKKYGGLDQYAVLVSMEKLKAACIKAIENKQVVRISGGDPVMYQQESVHLGQFVKESGGRFSMAHNGSSPKFALKVSPYLESAAIDIKGGKNDYPYIAGVNGKAYDNSFETVKVLLEENVLVDVRMVVFGFTQLSTIMEVAHGTFNIEVQHSDG